MRVKTIYRLASYDRATERMNGSVIIPPSVLGQVKVIAGFQPRDDGLGEYPLDEEQTRQVAYSGVPAGAGLILLLGRAIRATGGWRFSGANRRDACR
jgi:hypothetical protein